MRSRLALVMFAAAIGMSSVACGSDASSKNNYECQPLCAMGSGSVIGGNDVVEISADTEADADSLCVTDEAADGSACNSGYTVVKCSCDSE